MNIPVLIFYVILGTLAGSVICVIPGLHIYNVAGIAIIIWMGARDLIPYYALAPFFMALVVSFAFLNTIPMTFFNTMDESAGASMLPSNDLLARGRGKDAAMLSGMGTYTGAVLLLVLYPFFIYIWPYIASATKAHLHWMLGLVIVHYLMSEWPKGAGRGKNVWQKFREAWRNCFAGLLTFALAGIFGLIYFSKPIMPVQNSFQNVMPVFVGFFAIPSIIQSMISDFKVPPQYKSKYFNADWNDFSYGLLPGFVGGMLAAYLPAVTAGIGSMLASHATNHRSLQGIRFKPPVEKGTYVHLETPDMYYRQDRIFLVGGGITKILYYVGAFLLLFVLTKLTPYGTGRGGLTFILKPIFSAEPGDFLIMVATILLSASLAFLMLIYLTDLTIDILPRLNIKYIYAGALLLILALIFYIGGLTGIGVTMATTCIGMIPVFYGCRRSHCMAVLLVPLTLNMAGYGDQIVKILGLA